MCTWSSDFLTFFYKLNFVIFQALLLFMLVDNGYLVCATLPTVFETLQIFFAMDRRCACGLDIILRLFLSLFSQVELCHFFRRYYYLCEYIMGTLCVQPCLQCLKLCFRFLGHGPKMCMWFGYNSQIILSLFSEVELSHFSGVITVKVN